jgi:hypothetical protein
LIGTQHCIAHRGYRSIVVTVSNAVRAGYGVVGIMGADAIITTVPEPTRRHTPHETPHLLGCLVG